MGTGSVVKVAKDAFGPGNGLSHEFGLAMADERVIPAMFKQAVSDQICKSSVGAALRGELVLDKIPFDQILERECMVVQIVLGWSGLKYSGDNKVEAALRRAEAEWDGLTSHDRVIPGNLDLTRLFQAVYGFNDYCKSEGKTGIKLGHEPNKEWWRSDKQAKSLPTYFGVLRQDLTVAMQPTDLTGSPFYLNADEHEAWARERGGDGMTSVEETLYLFLRSAYEYGRPLWGVGWVRCRNTYGSDSHLALYWDAGDGLRVGRWGPVDRGWAGGCLARKFLGV